jgi:hypothetical protein
VKRDWRKRDWNGGCGKGIKETKMDWRMWKGIRGSGKRMEEGCDRRKWEGKNWE